MTGLGQKISCMSLLFNAHLPSPIEGTPTLINNTPGAFQGALVQERHYICHLATCARVRLWKRIAIRRKVGSDEISSKLKIFNTVYVVVNKQGNNYTIRDVISGKETVAHVSQIACMRSPVGPEESEEMPALTQNDEQV